jgi:hypothetical protein
VGSKGQHAIVDRNVSDFVINIIKGLKAYKLGKGLLGYWEARVRGGVPGV